MDGFHDEAEREGLESWLAHYDRVDDLARRRAAAAAVQQEKNHACEKRFASMPINEHSVRSLSDEDVWRLLDNRNRERTDERYSQLHSIQALDPEAQDNGMREYEILAAELDRRGGPLRPYRLYDDDDWIF